MNYWFDWVSSDINLLNHSLLKAHSGILVALHGFPVDVYAITPFKLWFAVGFIIFSLLALVIFYSFFLFFFFSKVAIDLFLWAFSKFPERIQFITYMVFMVLLRQVFYVVSFIVSWVLYILPFITRKEQYYTDKDYFDRQLWRTFFFSYSELLVDYFYSFYYNYYFIMQDGDKSPLILGSSWYLKIIGHLNSISTQFLQFFILQLTVKYVLKYYAILFLRFLSYLFFSLRRLCILEFYILYYIFRVIVRFFTNIIRTNFFINFFEEYGRFIFRLTTVSAEAFYMVCLLDSFANSRFIYAFVNPALNMLVPYVYYIQSYFTDRRHNIFLSIFLLRGFISSFSAVNVVFFQYIKSKVALNFRFLLFFKYFLRFFFELLNLIASASIFFHFFTLIQALLSYCICVCLYISSLLIKFNTSVLEFTSSLGFYIWLIFSKLFTILYFAFLYTIRFFCIRLLSFFSKRVLYLFIVFVLLCTSKDGFYLLLSVGDYYISWFAQLWEYISYPFNYKLEDYTYVSYYHRLLVDVCWGVTGWNPPWFYISIVFNYPTSLVVLKSYSVFEWARYFTEFTHYTITVLFHLFWIYVEPAIFFIWHYITFFLAPVSCFLRTSFYSMVHPYYFYVEWFFKLAFFDLKVFKDIILAVNTAYLMTLDLKFLFAPKFAEFYIDSIQKLSSWYQHFHYTDIFYSRGLPTDFFHSMSMSSDFSSTPYTSRRNTFRVNNELVDTAKFPYSWDIKRSKYRSKIVLTKLYVPMYIDNLNLYSAVNIGRITPWDAVSTNLTYFDIGYTFGAGKNTKEAYGIKPESFEAYGIIRGKGPRPIIPEDAIIYYDTEFLFNRQTLRIYNYFMTTSDTFEVLWFVYPYLVWIFIMLSLAYFSEGFYSWFVHTRRFIDSDAGWYSLQRDYKEQSMLFFSRILNQHDDRSTIFSFQRTLNKYSDLVKEFTPLGFWSHLLEERDFLTNKHVYFDCSGLEPVMSYPGRIDFIIAVAFKDWTRSYTKRYFSLYGDIEDFSTFQILLKALKIRHNLLTEEDYDYFRTFDRWDIAPQADPSEFDYVILDIFRNPIYESIMEDYVTEKKDDAFVVSSIIFLLNVSEVIFQDINQFDIDTEYEAISDSYLTSDFRALYYFDYLEDTIHVWTEMFYDFEHDIELFLIFTFDWQTINFVKVTDDLFFYDLLDAGLFDGMNRDDAHYYTFVSSFTVHFFTDAAYDEDRERQEEYEYMFEPDAPPVFLYPEKMSLYFRDVVKYFHDLDYFYFQYKLPRYFMHKDQSWYYLRDIQLVKPDERDIVIRAESVDDNSDTDFSPAFMGWGFILNWFPYYVLSYTYDFYLFFDMTTTIPLETIWYSWANSYTPLVYIWENYYNYDYDMATIHAQPEEPSMIIFTIHTAEFLDSIFDNENIVAERAWSAEILERALYECVPVVHFNFWNYWFVIPFFLLYNFLLKKCLVGESFIKLVMSFQNYIPLDLSTEKMVSTYLKYRQTTKNKHLWF